jgi:tetratricopeptide (TPR) repeat protein
LWWAWAFFYLSTGQPEKGLESFQKEIKNYPQNTQVYRALALEQINLRRKDDAIATLRSWLAITPTDADAIVLFSSLLMQDKRHSELLEPIQKTVSAHPDDARLRSLWPTCCLT